MCQPGGETLLAYVSRTSRRAQKAIRWLASECLRETPRGQKRFQGLGEGILSNSKVGIQQIQERNRGQNGAKQRAVLP